MSRLMYISIYHLHEYLSLLNQPLASGEGEISQFLVFINSMYYIAIVTLLSMFSVFLFLNK